MADSSSINAVSFSSARTTKRFPSSRCASTIQIIRPVESTAETQPKFQPALLRLSAMISQYFRWGARFVALLVERMAPRYWRRHLPLRDALR